MALAHCVNMFVTNNVQGRYLLIIMNLTRLLLLRRFGTPFKSGDFWYSWRNSGLQNQSVLHRHKDRLGEESEVFLDPNTWTEDGTATVGMPCAIFLPSRICGYW